MVEKPHKFKQVRDVLEYGKYLHAKLKALAERIEEDEQNARLKLLLEYLKRHEEELAKHLARFEQETQKHILELWLPYPPDSRIEKTLEAVTLHPNMSLEEIVKVVMEFEDALIELYRESLNEIDDPHVQEVLTNLVQLEEAEKRRLAMNVARFQEI